MAEFTTPEFLLNHSTDEIHETMKAIMPADLDMSEGGHAWNNTRPTALVAAELCEFILPEVIKLIFPEWSYGEFLDGHAKSRSMSRRPATAAAGEVTISGAVNTIIPAGSLFATASVNDIPSVDYKTMEEAEIPESGSVTVEIQCTQIGTVGNTGAGTIVLAASKLTGITAVINEKDVSGGTEAEDDESLIIRIEEYDESQGSSFVGNVADYKRWAKSVAGVGEATVIPAQDDTGLVTIIVTDANGEPATEQLCEAVYNFIMKPDNPGERLAPPNAYLSVEPPTTLSLGITATVELEESADIEGVKTAFLPLVAAYLAEALDDAEIKYTRIAAILSATAGVNDYKDVQIGIIGGDYGTGNIAITNNQLPTVDKENLVLTSGAV